MTNGVRDIRETLRQILASDDPTTSPAQRLCLRCAEFLPVSGAAISVSAANGVRDTLSVSNGVMEAIEELQFTTGIGPCVDSMAQGRPVLVPELDAAADARWPGFTDKARAAGVGALFGFPLRIGAISLGAMDMYREEPGSLGSRGLADALLTADAATVALINMQGQEPLGALDDRWWDLSSFRHAVVHQATGVVMGELGLNASEAYVRVRAYALTHDLPVDHVARAVVDRELRLDSDADPAGRSK